MPIRGRRGLICYDRSVVDAVIANYGASKTAEIKGEQERTP